MLFASSAHNVILISIPLSTRYAFATSTVERKEDVRTVNTKAGSTVDVANAYLVDNGMEIKITLWAEDANNIQNGDKIKIENGYTNEFKGEVQLGKGKFGKLEKI